MTKEVSAGGVVYSRDQGEPCILLIMDMYGQWTLPKGHVEPGETHRRAALREIEEEIGIKGFIEYDLGETHYEYRRDSQTMDKVVHYYLVRAPRTELRLAPAEVRDAKWVSLDRVLEISGYANNRSVLERAIDLLRAQPTR